MTSSIQHATTFDISRSSTSTGGTGTGIEARRLQQKKKKQQQQQQQQQHHHQQYRSRKVVPVPVPSFQLYQKPKSLTPQRCQRIVRYARKRLRGQDSNCEDSHDNATFELDTKVISHSNVELGNLLGKGAFSSVYAINSIASETRDDIDNNNDNNNDNDNDNDNNNNNATEGMVVKFLRTRLYENHGLFAASAADLVKEGNILSSLSHTNVIRLHAVSSLYGVDAYASGYHDAFFLVLERLECTLSDRINEWQSRHKKLYYEDQLAEEYDPMAQFVVNSSSSSSSSSKNNKNNNSTHSTSSWKKKLALLRNPKKASGAFLEASDRTTATVFTAALSCDESCDDCENDGDYNNNNSGNNNNNNKIALAKSELLSERVDVTLQLADALAYLHKNHVIHRDLKPDNIGFGADGVLKVFDFDIARVVPSTKHRYSNSYSDDDSFNEDSSIFQSSMSFSVWNKNKTENELFHMTQKVGSPRYMSPECARREPYNLKADVYSYALLTHQILTLQKPYDDISDAEHDELVFYRGIRPHVPVGLPSGTQNLLGSAWSDTVSKRPTMEVVRSVLAEQRSEILRMGTLERTAPSVPVANTTAYVWSCSFAAVSDNNEMLRRIEKKNKKSNKFNKSKKTRSKSNNNGNSNGNSNSNKPSMLRAVFQKSKSNSSFDKAGMRVANTTVVPAKAA